MVKEKPKKSRYNAFHDATFSRVIDLNGLVRFWKRYVSSAKYSEFKKFVTDLFDAFLKSSDCRELHYILAHIYMCDRFEVDLYKHDLKIINKVLALLGHCPEDYKKPHECINSYIEIGHVALLQKAIPVLEEARGFLKAKVPANRPKKDDLLSFECSLVEFLAKRLQHGQRQDCVRVACEHASQLLRFIDVRKLSSTGEGLYGRLSEFVKEQRYFAHYCAPIVNKHFSK